MWRTEAVRSQSLVMYTHASDEQKTIWLGIHTSVLLYGLQTLQ